jgi:hypothetical protein
MPDRLFNPGCTPSAKRDDTSEHLRKQAKERLREMHPRDPKATLADA